MLTINNLIKQYRSFRLNIPNLTVRKNTITGFIGRNGAGKTTTIKCILGLTPYHSGDIYLDGLSSKKQEKKYKDNIGVVFDEGYFFDSLTIKETGSIISGAYSGWNMEKYRHYLSKYELSDKLVVKDLSKGMRMKLSLALAFSHNAEFLLLDEPSGGLDPEMRFVLGEELVAQKKGGKTIFLSTHITSDLDRITDDVILIDRGNILFQGTKQAFLQKHDGLEYRSIEERMLSFLGVK